MPRNRAIAIALLAGVSLYACRTTASGPRAKDGDSVTPSAAPRLPKGYTETSGKDGWTTVSTGEADRPGPRKHAMSFDLRRASRTSKAEAAPARSDALAGGPAVADGGHRRSPQLGPLKAGEVDDNAAFRDYLLYHKRQSHLVPASYRMDVSERYLIEARDQDGKPLPNCQVAVAALGQTWMKGLTDARGRVYFFPRVAAVSEDKPAMRFEVTFAYGGHTVRRTFARTRLGGLRMTDGQGNGPGGAPASSAPKSAPAPSTPAGASTDAKTVDVPPLPRTDAKPPASKTVAMPPVPKPEAKPEPKPEPKPGPGTQAVSADWVAKLPTPKAVHPVTLEVLFLLDTTGSMADEIAQIQRTLLAITEKIRRMPGQPRIRYGMVLYRDRGDEYVTRRFGFTEDVQAFDQALRAVRAAGGGDMPESMNLGLYAAVDQMAWSPNALRLAFLVADAPPHTDYAQDVPYPGTLRRAVEKGIKIYPTAASGLDARGSYVMRQIAQFTGAKFLFIEYGQSGASHGIGGSYDTNNLDDLVLRIVKSELAHYAK